MPPWRLRLCLAVVWPRFLAIQDIPNVVFADVHAVLSGDAVFSPPERYITSATLAIYTTRKYETSRCDLDRDVPPSATHMSKAAHTGCVYVCIHPCPWPVEKAR